jgi:hypothetical protein
VQHIDSGVVVADRIAARERSTSGRGQAGAQQAAPLATVLEIGNRAIHFGTLQ